MRKVHQHYFVTGKGSVFSFFFFLGLPKGTVGEDSLHEPSTMVRLSVVVTPVNTRYLGSGGGVGWL